MKKLLLSSVSVMAFVSAATQASTVQTETPAPSLAESAQQQLAMSIMVPEINLNEVVKSQALTALNDETQRVLSNRLFAMNDKESTVTPVNAE